MVTDDDRSVVVDPDTSVRVELSAGADIDTDEDAEWRVDGWGTETGRFVGGCVGGLDVAEEVEQLLALGLAVLGQGGGEAVDLESLDVLDECCVRDGGGVVLGAFDAGGELEGLQGAAAGDFEGVAEDHVGVLDGDGQDLESWW